MAQQRYEQQTTIQPSQPVADTASAAEAASWQRMGQAADWFGQLVANEMQYDALDKAERDAPRMIQRDGDGNLVPVVDFDPLGGGPVYRRRFAKAAQEIYKQNAISDLDGYASQLAQQFPDQPEKIRGLLTEKRNLMLHGMAEGALPLVAPQLDMLIGQHTSRAFARKNGSDRALQEKNLKEGEFALIRDLAASGAQPGQIVTADAAGNIVARAGNTPTAAGMAARIESFREQLRGLGLSDAAINDRLANLDHNVSRRILEKSMYGEIVAAWHPTDPARMLLAQRNAARVMRDWLDRNGNRPEDRAFLSQSLSDAVNDVRLTQAATAEDMQAQADQRQAEILRQRQAFIDIPNPSAEQRKAHADWRRDTFQSIMDDSTMTPAIKLRLASGVFGPGPELASAYSDAATQSVQILQSNTARHDQKEFAASQLSMLAEDPGFRRSVGGQGVAGVRNALDQYNTGLALSATAGDFMSLAAQGRIGPAALEAFERRATNPPEGQPALITDDGRNGTWRKVDWQSRIKPEVLKAWREREAADKVATDAVTRWQQEFSLLRPEQAKLVEERSPFRALSVDPATGRAVGVPYNPADPSHNLQAAQYVGQNGFVPSEVASAMQAITTAKATPEEKAGMVNLMGQLFAVWSRTQAPGVPPAMQQKLFHEWVGKAFSGEVEKYAAMLLRRGTDLDAQQEAQALSAKSEAAARLFGGQDKMDEAYRATMEGPNSLNVQGVRTFATGGILDNIGLYFQNMTDDPTLVAIYKPIADNSPGVITRDNMRQLVMSEEAANAHRERTFAWLERHGSDHEKLGEKELMKLASMMAMQSLSGDFGAITRPDGRPEITYRPLQMLMSKATGLPVSEQGARDIGVAMFRWNEQQALASGRSLVAVPVDLASAVWTSDVVEGRQVFRLIARPQDPANRVPVTLVTQPADSPWFTKSGQAFLRDIGTAADIPGVWTFFNNLLGGVWTQSIITENAEAVAALRSGRDPGRAGAKLLLNLYEYQVRTGLLTADAELYKRIGREEMGERLNRMPWYDTIGPFLTRTVRRFGEAGPQAGPTLTSEQARQLRQQTLAPPPAADMLGAP